MPVETGGDPVARKRGLRVRARELAPATTDESIAVMQRLRTMPELARARRVCVFLAMPGEVDLAALEADVDDAHWVTTRTGDGPLLTVHDLAAPRERHRFGFEQPVTDTPRIAADTIDLWLVPGLAFDLRGNRLGNGAGYYDRLLATAHPAATFVGITLERRLFDGLPHEAHDRRMHVVVTEARTIRVTEVDPGIDHPPPSDEGVGSPGAG